MNLICGIDEAGRGPLAGPVAAGAVILPEDFPVAILKDSKQLNHKKREEIFGVIQSKAKAWSVGWASNDEIDRLNIHQASLLAMQRACRALAIPPDYALIDGRFCPFLDCGRESIVRGDETIPQIMAASIIAKVLRDRLMERYDALFPEYAFEQHKGYPTPKHLEVLKRIGACCIHRVSFKHCIPEM